MSLSADVSEDKIFSRFQCVELRKNLVCLFILFLFLSFLGMFLGDIFFSPLRHSDDSVVSSDAAVVTYLSESGAWGPRFVNCTDKPVIWGVGADWNGYSSSSLLASVFAQAPLYLVIDLSGGKNATNYPVAFLDAVPPGGWSDEYKTDKLVMRKIPAGTFVMGKPSNEFGRINDNLQHTVTLTKDFYIGVFEVTQRQWQLVMGDRPSYFTNAAYYATRPVEAVSYYDIRENPRNNDDPRVDWPNNNAVNPNSFMGKLRARTGFSTFDLPTESQWEYACRAGSTTALNTGYNLASTSRDPRMDAVGRHEYNGGRINGTTITSSACTTNNGTAKVGSYLPNAWGLYDMQGNVKEWCLDWYGDYPGTVIDPPGSSSGVYRVSRGGDWYDGADGRWPQIRSYSDPPYKNCIASNGFRAACILP